MLVNDWLPRAIDFPRQPIARPDPDVCFQVPATDVDQQTDRPESSCMPFAVAAESRPRNADEPEGNLRVEHNCKTVDRRERSHPRQPDRPRESQRSQIPDDSPTVRCSRSSRCSNAAVVLARLPLRGDEWF